MIRLLHSLVTVLHFSLYMKKANSSLDRSSRSEVFCEKVVLKNFAKFTTCRQFCKKKKLPCVQTCWKQLYCWICFLVTTEYQKVRVANFGGLEGLLLTSQMLRSAKNESQKNSNPTIPLDRGQKTMQKSPKNHYLKISCF